jgi:hypothetical protein
MKIAHLLCAIWLCAIWLCAPFALKVGAADSPEHIGSSAAATKMGQAAGRAAPSRDANIKPGHSESEKLTQVGSAKHDALKRPSAAIAASPHGGFITQQRGVGQVPRSNADRLSSQLSTKARGMIAKTSSRPIGSNHAAVAGNVVARGVRGASPVGLPTLPASSAARISPTPTVVPPGSIVGGPHAAGAGRLGGPSTARNANSATINGSFRRRKF